MELNKNKKTVNSIPLKIENFRHKKRLLLILILSKVLKYPNIAKEVNKIKLERLCKVCKEVFKKNCVASAL